MASDMWTSVKARACCQRRPARTGADASLGGGRELATAEKPAAPSAASTDAARAQELKERGNEHFREKRYEEALAAYSDACVLDQRNPALWLNRSIANRHLQNWEDAEQDAQIAAELEPSNAKAHYSRALALQQLGSLQKALKSCRLGLQRQPDSKPLQQLRAAVERQLAAAADAGAAAAQQGANVKAEAAARQQEQPLREKLLQATDCASLTEGACPVAQIEESELQDGRRLAQSAEYQWQGRDPSPAERDSLKKMITDMFRGKYAELKARREEAQGAVSILQTDQYEKEQKLGLKIEGGHRPMPRPKNVELPSSFREPLGVISLEELRSYSVENESRRYLVSVYGNLFDVSDRPDKYGPDGPYAGLTGSDLTWAMFTGVDQPEFTSRFYDLFKAKDMGKDKMAGVCSWQAWYEAEYGESVGMLEPYTREWELPAPPIEEVDEMACAVM